MKIDWHPDLTHEYESRDWTTCVTSPPDSSPFLLWQDLFTGLNNSLSCHDKSVPVSVCVPVLPELVTLCVCVCVCVWCLCVCVWRTFCLHFVLKASFKLNTIRSWWTLCWATGCTVSVRVLISRDILIPALSRTALTQTHMLRLVGVDDAKHSVCDL